MPATFVQRNVLHAPLGNDDRADLLVDERGVGHFRADEWGVRTLRAHSVVSATLVQTYAVSAVFVQTPPEWLHEVVCGVA
jgi:hypothetical protein